MTSEKHSGAKQDLGNKALGFALLRAPLEKEFKSLREFEGESFGLRWDEGFRAIGCRTQYFGFGFYGSAGRCFWSFS